MGSSTTRAPGGRRRLFEDVTLEARGRWWTLRAPIPRHLANADPAGGEWLDRQGLWKPTADATEQICDLPTADLDLTPAELGDSGPGETAALLGWVLASRHGLDDIAEPPPNLRVDPRDLAVRTGPFTCQGTLHTGGGRVFLDFPMGSATTATVTTLGRTAWLERTIAATCRYRLVRVGRGPTDDTIHARIDLTGCPRPWFDRLLARAIAHLRATVQQILPAITLLTDASVASRAFELGAPAPTQGDEDHD